MLLNRENYESAFIDYIEGTLSMEDQIGVQKFIEANPDLKAELELFEETILVPDESIVYPYKSSLKKKEDSNIVQFLHRYGLYAAAAAIILFAAFTFLNKTKKINQVPDVVINSQKPTLNNSKENEMAPVVISPGHSNPYQTVTVNNPVKKIGSPPHQVEISERDNDPVAVIYLHQDANLFTKSASSLLIIQKREKKLANPESAVNVNNGHAASYFQVASVLLTDLYKLSGRTTAFGKPIVNIKRTKIGNLNIKLGILKFIHRPAKKFN